MLLKKLVKYYNTSRRKNAKKWSDLNVFFKLKKPQLYIATKKYKYKIYPIIFFYNLYFFKFLEFEYNYIYDKNQEVLKLKETKKRLKFPYFFNLKNKIKNKIKNRSNKYLKKILNIIVYINYLYNGLINFYMAFCYMYKTYLIKKRNLFKIAFADKMLSLNIFYSYIKSYYLNFVNYSKDWQNLITAYSFDITKSLIFFNLYNLKALLSLDIFMLWFNIAELKFDNDKFYKKKEEWSKIRKLSFNYFKLNLLKKNSISFFSFCIFEFYIYINENFFNIFNFKFLDYYIDIDRERSYVYQKNRELNWRYRDLKYEKKEYSTVQDYFNLDYSFLNLNQFNIRVRYSVFIAWFNYIVFFKRMRYHLYIRNNPYFYNFTSHKVLFLHYNNPAGFNKTKVTMKKYDKILKELHFGIDLSIQHFNNGYSFFNLGKYTTLYKYEEKDDNVDMIFYNKFTSDFNIKQMINYVIKRYWRNSLNFFTNKNLKQFMNTNTVLGCYELAMRISSINKFRGANLSFCTIKQMTSKLFSLPTEAVQYLNYKNKKITKNILFNFYKKNYVPYYFFKDFYNYTNTDFYYNNLNLLKYYNKLSYLSLYFLNPKFFFNLLGKKLWPSSFLSYYKKRHMRITHEKYWVSKFKYKEFLYNIFNLKKKKKMRINMWDFRYIVKKFYKEWKSIRFVRNLVNKTIKIKLKLKKDLNLLLKVKTYVKNMDLRFFYLLWNYNTGFYLVNKNNYDDANLLYGLNSFYFIKKSRLINIFNKSNLFFGIGSYYKIVKLIPFLKAFYFQLLYEDKELNLLLFYLLLKETNLFLNNSKNFINIKNIFFNNFIYRYYIVTVLFNSRYFDSMFNNFNGFIKDDFDKILTPFIYRKYYNKYEHLSFFSANIKNNFNHRLHDIIL